VAGSEVDGYLDVLRRLAGASSDAELAEKLGIAKQTISSWRRRGTVPSKSQQAFARQLRYWKESREWQLVLAVMLATFDINKAGGTPLPFSEYVKWGAALSHSEDGIRSALRKLEAATGRDRDPALVEMMMVMLRAGNVPGVTEAIDVWVRDRYGLTEGPQ
jgi:transcriptional regulator with XRE-family HTH domain